MQQQTSSMEVIDSIDKERWNNLTENLDIYFSNQYHRIFENLGDGKAKLIFYQLDGNSIIYPFFLREIPNTIYFDISSVYGYSGPSINLKFPDKLKELIEGFKSAFNNYAHNNKIVSEFIRFHPFSVELNFKSIYEIRQIKETIYMEINSSTNIWDNIHSKKRNMIRKAEKNGVTVREVKPGEYIDIFYDIYTKTMEKNNASDYYFFDMEFFINTINLLEGNIKMFAAFLDCEIVSVALIMLKKPFAHYHFSGTTSTGLKVAANDLLLYKISEELSLLGFHYFHLGGGYTNSEDSLFKFKRGFSTNCKTNFNIGTKIHNQAMYNQLVIDRKIDKDSDYFPLYRKI